MVLVPVYTAMLLVVVATVVFCLYLGLDRVVACDCVVPSELLRLFGWFAFLIDDLDGQP